MPPPPLTPRAHSGCNHCTVSKDCKHLILADYTDADGVVEPYMQPILGKPRTKAESITMMKQFEIDLAAHLKAKKKHYVGKHGLASYKSWCKPALGHLPNHIALTWIRKYSLEK